MFGTGLGYSQYQALLFSLLKRRILLTKGFVLSNLHVELLPAPEVCEHLRGSDSFRFDIRKPQRPVDFPRKPTAISSGSAHFHVS